MKTKFIRIEIPEEDHADFKAYTARRGESMKEAILDFIYSRIGRLKGKSSV